MEVEQSSVSEERAVMSLWGGGTALWQGWALPSSFHRGGGAVVISGVPCAS